MNLSSKSFTILFRSLILSILYLRVISLSSRYKSNDFSSSSRPRKADPLLRNSFEKVNTNEKLLVGISEPTKTNKLESEVAVTTLLAEEERLQKIIARAGIASRRDAETMITSGRVVVNGKQVKELGTKVHPRKDKIMVDGKLISLPDNKGIFWIALNKPKDCITTMDDGSDRQTILQFIPKANDLRLVPVGRMDRHATGLLLLTNEVGWIHPLTHPSFKIKKRLELVIQGIPSDAMLEAASSGKVIPGSDNKRFPKCAISLKDFDKIQNISLVDVTLEDMTTAALEELLEAIGCPLISSKRTDFGPLKLKGLKKGEWRELTATEINKLKESVQRSDTSGTARQYVAKKQPSEDSSRSYNSFEKGIRRFPRRSERESSEDKNTPYSTSRRGPSSRPSV